MSPTVQLQPLKLPWKFSVYVQTLNKTFNLASQLKTECPLVLKSRWFESREKETAMKEWTNRQCYIQHCLNGLDNMLTIYKRDHQRKPVIYNPEAKQVGMLFKTYKTKMVWLSNSFKHVLNWKHLTSSISPCLKFSDSIFFKQVGMSWIFK